MENNMMKTRNFILITAFVLALCAGSRSSQAQYNYYDTSTPQGSMQEQMREQQQQQQFQQQQMLEQQQRQMQNQANQQQQQYQQQQQMQQQQYQQQKNDPLGLATSGQW
jgi:TolA-binding protein